MATTDTAGANLAMTILEFCRSARISRRTFYNLMERGEAPATITIGRRRIIRREMAEAWLQAREAA